MQLDTLTLMAMGSFVAACSGTLLLVAWWANRKLLALAIWGIAGLAAAAGILCLMMATAYQEPLLMIGAGYWLALNHGLIWKGARALDEKPAPIALALAGVGLLFVVGLLPASIRGAGPLVISAAYLLAATISLWRGRAERLPARLPLTVLLGVHASVTLIGTVSMIGSRGVGIQVPELMSFFGIIHFESIIFAVGTAAFALSLVKERSEAASQLAAVIDPLTGIANRAGFLDAAAKIMHRCQREGAPVSVIMFDLDKFKSINDTFGHATGDAVIRKFCAVTAAALRPYDAFGRLGGEEFAVVMAATSIEAAAIRADRIRAAFEADARIVDDHQVLATVSAGVSESAKADAEIGSLLKLSDQALYAAKAAGRNRVKRADQLDAKRVRSDIIRVA